MRTSANGLKKSRYVGKFFREGSKTASLCLDLQKIVKSLKKYPVRYHRFPILILIQYITTYPPQSSDAPLRQNAPKPALSS